MKRADELKLYSGAIILVVAMTSFVLPLAFFLVASPLGIFVSGYLSGKSDELRRKELAEARIKGDR